jgi:beta-lactamase superfamily II metal-dependent hydrolase
LIDTAAEDRSSFHRKFIDWVAAEKRPRHLGKAGDEFRLTRDVTARILFPPVNFQGDRADDQALVVQLQLFGKSRVLLMSDSGKATEDFLRNTLPDLRSEIIIKGQHHTGISGTEEFLDHVRPAAIIATSRDFPESERIKPEWAEQLAKRQIKLIRQDATGAVQVRLFRDRWEATSYVTGEIFRSESR